MLDTNICIYILKNRPSGLRDRLETSVIPAISSVVYAELCYGVEESLPHLQESRRKQLHQFIDLLEVMDWDNTAARHYAEIRSTLKRQGTPIGNMDLLIAAHARSLDRVLVTNNIGEFTRVDGLRLENWV
uniref:Ribonuclease VapC n=1 Tax=Candidatus Kentrum eta TaxID=2126337 RepID=A0A450V129_9GAMM|nr:MAG: tRNA(fMet)-specific endonuclease VapC [Candidatus Kentron sp. H]VFJ98534.1 MAG: tRNA(fMet)-specific endonuclease VapC [Candidatus Kentron sp. H]VFK03501.1 MAG: tRNA(fMet)-specific endonuclease VapC [Candidatus Kentron sp. H]